MKYQLVFHISLLEPIAYNPLKEQKGPPPLPIVGNDEQKYEAEEVIDSKLIQNKLY